MLLVSQGVEKSQSTRVSEVVGGGRGREGRGREGERKGRFVLHRWLDSCYDDEDDDDDDDMGARKWRWLNKKTLVSTSMMANNVEVLLIICLVIKLS